MNSKNTFWNFSNLVFFYKTILINHSVTGRLSEPLIRVINVVNLISSLANFSRPIGYAA